MPETTPLSKPAAVRRWLMDNRDGNGMAQLGLKEFRDFWETCSPEDKEQFAKVSAEHLGVELSQ